MAAINILSFPGTIVIPQAVCECVCEAAGTHVPVARIPLVRARWTVETSGDGTRQLVERWSIHQRGHDSPETLV